MSRQTARQIAEEIWSRINGGAGDPVGTLEKYIERIRPKQRDKTRATSVKGGRCVCETPSEREIRTFGGELVAVQCGLCTRNLWMVCQKCGAKTADLAKHSCESTS